MNSTPPSAVSSKNRTARPGEPSFRALVQSRIDKLTSFAAAGLDRLPILGAFLRLRVAWILMIFVIGVAAGITWESYSTAKGGTSSGRLKAMSLALSAARQNLDKAASEMSRLEAQGLDVPQRRSAR
jgi:hypothetical protein